MATTAGVMTACRSSQSCQDELASTSAQMEWVKQMRRQFSPPDMLSADGEINQDFFKPTKIVIVEDKKWGPAERDLLYEGLEKHGVGKWREISSELLPRWDETTLRVKASRLFGSQSLARYPGWKGNREAVDAEFKKNKEIGDKTGCWKTGYLVEDDNGSVKQALEELESTRAAPK